MTAEPRTLRYPRPNRGPAAAWRSVISPACTGITSILTEMTPRYPGAMPATSATTPLEGDADLAGIGSVLADRAGCRILLALADGRALPASVLADEAGVAASTASAHLSRLVKGGMLRGERHGGHR